MRFTPDVDVPEELVAAALDGSLAIFVGAGVSLNAPSNLPLFNGLAEQLAKLHGENYDGKSPADAYLGRLVDRLPIVREQAKSIIGSPQSAPNANHYAIVRLASHSAATRLVTTNFDEHLTGAATLEGIDLGDRFNGPAVPLARDFAGLVHLHGAVSRPSSELVLTDGDFGRAYLTDGWARRFVQELFLSRVVLFIGYSHDDTVMKYLARGLPPTTSRYALTDVGDDPKWTDLHITPVRYPGDDDHAALAQVLDAWADRLAMGQLEHRSRVKAIVQGGPPKIPVDEDYIRAAVTTPVGVRAFAEQASGREWLIWAEQQPEFVAMFQSGRLESDSSREFARWFADTYLVDDTTAELALGVIARLGPVASHDLMQGLTYGAYRLRQSNPALFVKLSIVISTALRTDDTDPEQNWMILYEAPIDATSVMPFLRRALRPRLVLSENRPWFLSDDADEPPSITARIAWSTGDSDLQMMWEAAKSDFPTVAVTTLHTFEQALRDAYELLNHFNPQRSWDSYSARRSAIEPHEQDSTHSLESTLIDGLRDASVLLGASDATILPRWLADQFPLFRRLAIHALAEDAQLDGHQKIDLLLVGEHLYDHHLKHEVFRLLALVAPNLNEQDRARLLRRVLQGPLHFDPTREKRLHHRSIFDFVEWLARYVPDWPELAIALGDIYTQEPDMGIRPHPDFDSYMTSGVWGGKLPYEVDDFVVLIRAEGAAAALSELRSRDYSERNFDEPDWDDALSLLRQVVQAHPELGQELLNYVAGDREADLTAAILRGWAASDLNDEQLKAAVERADQLIENGDLVRALSEFVLGAVDSRVESRVPDQLKQLDHIAQQLWERYAQGFEHPESEDWTFMGLNTWPGFIAQYWINRIRLRWRAAQDNWIGLTLGEKEVLSAMLGATSAAGQGPLAIIAGEAYFLHAADSTYTVGEIFPRFDGSVDDRAWQAWTGFLYHARVDDSMLDDGFWDLLVHAHRLIQGRTSGLLEGQYWHLLASIAIHSSADSTDRAALIDELARNSESGLASFFDALADILEGRDESDVRRVWNGWLCPLLQQRTQLLPGTVSDAEKTSWGDLALRCGPVLSEALGLSANIPGPLGQKTNFHNLSDAIVRDNADLIANIVRERTLATSTPNWHVEHQLRMAVQKLSAAGADPASVRAVIEAAISIGIHGAGQWIRD